MTLYHNTIVGGDNDGIINEAVNKLRIFLLSFPTLPCMFQTADIEENYQERVKDALPSLEKLKNEPESIVLSTAPFDPRFPNANQTKNCWQNYVDYHMCRAAKGEEYPACHYFERNYKIICPQAWVARWDEQRKEGRFAGNLEPPELSKLEKMAGHH